MKGRGLKPIIFGHNVADFFYKLGDRRRVWL
jgi:hypothetical protein